MADLTRKQYDVMCDLSDHYPAWVRPLSIGGKANSGHSEKLYILCFKKYAQRRAVGGNYEYRLTDKGIEAVASINPFPGYFRPSSGLTGKRSNPHN